jgi:hypothetical protein
VYRTRIAVAAMSACLASAGMLGAAAAQDDATAGAKPDQSIVGTVQMVTAEDGRIVYTLDTGEGEPIELGYGPSWFSGLLNPLHALVGTEITVEGNLRDGLPNENASDTAKENAVKAPQLKVRTIDGAKRDKGKPAWAGGPNVVGETHPGHEGWSKGQSNKADKSAKPDKPAKAGPKGPLEDK